MKELRNALTILMLFFVVAKGEDSIMKLLLKKIDELERKDTEFAAKQEELEEKVKIYSDLTAKLQDKLKEKDRVMGEMKLQLNGFEEIIRNLQTRQHESKVRPDKTAAEYSDNRNFVNEEKAQIEKAILQNVSSPNSRQELNTDSYTVLRRQAINPGENVAFHAVNNQGEISHIGFHQNIVFETVLLNLNKAYHPQHEVFIAPTAGLYIFSTSILSFKGQKTHLFQAEMVKNGVLLAMVYGNGDQGYHDQGAVTVIVQLATGDEVWVRLNCCADDSLYRGYYTSFTGALLNLL